MLIKDYVISEEPRFSPSMPNETFHGILCEKGKVLTDNNHRVHPWVLMDNTYRLHQMALTTNNYSVHLMFLTDNNYKVYT